MMDGGEDVGQIAVSVQSIKDEEKAAEDEKKKAAGVVKRQRAWLHDTECFECKTGLTEVEEIEDKPNADGKRSKTTEEREPEVKVRPFVCCWVWSLV